MQTMQRIVLNLNQKLIQGVKEALILTIIGGRSDGENLQVIDKGF